MFFNLFKHKHKDDLKDEQSVHTTLPPYVIRHSLLEEELQNRKKGINHSGVVFDINIMEKEDVLMVEKLKAYRAELEAKRNAILAEDNTAKINADVEAYRKSLIEADIATKAETAREIDSKIMCLDDIIAREEAAEVTVLSDLTESTTETNTVSE